MLHAILFLIVLMPFWAIVNRQISKKYNIEREWGFNFVNKIDKFGTIAIYVVVPISFLTILYVTDIRVPGNSTPFMPQFIFVLYLLIATFRTVMQWKYNKEAKRYILGLSNIVFTLVGLIGITFIFPWT